ncbi:Acetyltransferase (GNAT) domain-containing protein [Paenibacillus tianmuensis]|uniref:Acetyltransferase (GNAT) domain-containing protein n=1 Tax=Paenibacillus tianmuensis TaxID=624147 RepID=A0A1G4RHE2_9BACL|nr:GNAT family N-acetyltransferase [Paenibacillus tianmuensis]SCW56220.1 Acetyltransferase (GNAT) domain-containing protein [Paenibacillus tianmuensis]
MIRRPTIEDIKELNEFFRIVITDTYIKEGIGDMLNDLEVEIKAKENYLHRDLESDGKDRYFLIALDGEKIIGSIEYGPSSELINHCTEHALKDVNEVGTVFVHPDYQRQGIGNQLLVEMYLTLKSEGIEEFCLDSGYTNAQKIWKKKYGEPDYLLKDYWGETAHHMIWRVKVNDLLTRG